MDEAGVSRGDWRVYGGNEMLKIVRALVCSGLLLATVLVGGYGEAANTWNSEVVDNTGDWGSVGPTSIALDATGYPHIGYGQPSNDAIKYAYYDGSSWHIETVVTGGVGSVPDYVLALDSNNRPHMSFFHSGGGGGSLKYAYHDGSSWQIQMADSGSTESGIIDVGRFNCIAVDSNNRPHISYYDQTSGTTPPLSTYCLKYAHYTGSEWQTVTVDAPEVGSEQIGWATSITLDSSDRPHISYWHRIEDSYYLKYAYYDGLSWQIQTADTSDNWDITTSLALDANNRAHILYRYTLVPSDPYAPLEYSFKYAYYDGSSWQIQTIDTGGTGQYFGVALDNSDRAHIVYWDTDTEGMYTELKYAYHDGTSWQTETVLEHAKSSAITLDVNGHPHISCILDNNLYYASIDGSAAPSPPSGLTASSGDSKVTLSWNSVSGIASYNVYRSTTSGSGFAKINTSAVTATTYIDTTVTNGTTYYYHVKSVQDSAESSASSEVSGGQDAPSGVNLTIGWNLLSLYLEPSDTDIESVLAGIKDNIVSAWKWVDNNWTVWIPTSVMTTDDLNTYISNKGFVLLENIHCGEGFWANSDIFQILTVSGTQPSDTSSSLTSGWNLGSYQGSWYYGPN